jgi:anti-sigma B factor antagonist
MDGEDPDLTSRGSGDPPSSLLSVEIVLGGVATSVVVVGELDISTGGHLRDVLAPLLANGPSEVVLECAQLSFLDVGGISVLLDIEQELNESGRHLSLRSLRPNLHRVLEMVDVTGALDVID